MFDEDESIPKHARQFRLAIRDWWTSFVVRLFGHKVLDKSNCGFTIYSYRGTFYVTDAEEGVDDPHER